MSATQYAIRSTQPQHEDIALIIQDLNAWYGKFLAVRNVSMEIPRNKITGLIGPSGSGKSTVLRCLNRIHETAPGTKVAGKVTLDNVDIYSDLEVGEVRRAIG